MTGPSRHADADAYKALLRTHFDTYAGGWHQRMENHVYAMRYRAVQRMVTRLDAGSVLDVGCGTGDYAQLFDPARVRYFGIDISEKMIAECRRLFPAHRFAVADGDSIDAPNESYDLVLSIGVLEYLPDPGGHLRELARVTKPGGNIIAAVQNGSNRSRRLDRPVRAILDSAQGRAIRQALGRPVGLPAQPTDGGVKDARVLHLRMTAADLRATGSPLGLELAESAHVSLYVLPELIPGAARVNSVISRALSLRPGWERLQRATGLVLVGRWTKNA
jgi:SAM-dependent methyltransferase